MTDQTPPVQPPSKQGDDRQHIRADGTPKRAFESRSAALRFVEPHQMTTPIYRCGVCGQWHVASKQGEERWANCAECGDTGLMSALAPCTTFGSDCACNGPRIEVPCEFCGLGEGRA